MAKRKRKVGVEKSGLLANKLIRQFLLQTTGENSLKIVKEFTEKMSDEDLARSCKFKVSEVRSVLNKLHGYGMAKYERIKDKETGWYSYIWNLDLDEMLKYVDNEKSRKVGSKEKVPSGAASELYNCSKCDSESIPFESAVDNYFKCPGCGSQLAYVNQAKE